MHQLKQSASKRSLAKFLLVLIISAAVQINVASASSVQQLTIDDMLGSAELIFEGQVTQTESRWNTTRSAINTLVTFEIIDVIQGDYDSTTIQLSFAGGTADDVTMQVHGMVYPQHDEQGIYFVEKINQILVNPIVGWNQGHFLIVEDSTGEQSMLTADRQAIIEMTDESVSGQAISEGVAAGVKVTPQQSRASKGMSKASFKQALQDKLRARKAAR